MAFPTIPTGSRVLFTNQADASGTRTFPSLSSLTKNAGDLLVAICVGYQSAGTSGAVFSSWGASFTERADLMTTSGSTMCVGIATKISDGTETGTFTVTQASPTGHATLILMSIPGGNRVTAIEAGAIANGTTAAADPASFNPANWDVEDTLWIALTCNGMTSGSGTWTGTGASAPANFGSRLDSNTTDSSTVGQTEAAVSFRQQAAASQDVGTESGQDVTNARNSAVCIAVRPANDQTVTPGVATLAITRYAPVIKHQIVVPVRSLTLTKFAPAARIGSTVTPGKLSMATTTYAPTVTVAAGGVTVTPGTSALTTTRYAPVLKLVVIPPARALTTTRFAPVLKLGVIPGVRTLSTVSFAPTVATPRLATPSTKALAITRFAPTVSTPRLATPDTRSLALTRFAPTVSAPRTVVPATRTLTTISFAPSVATPRLVVPPTRALSLTRYAPIVLAPRLVVPGTRSLTVTRFAPGVYAGVTVVAGRRDLTTTAFAPSVTVTEHVRVVPGTRSLATTRFAPSVYAPRTATPGTRVMVIDLKTPAAVVDHRVVAGVEVLTLTRFAPDVSSSGGGVTVVPPTRALVTTLFAPTVTVVPLFTLAELLAQLALDLHGGDVANAGEWLLRNGAMRVNRGRMPIRDPLLGSIHRKASAATFAQACVILGVTGPVLEDLKRLGGVA